MVADNSSRTLFTVATALFVVHNIIFLIFTVRQFKEEQVLRKEHQEQIDKINVLKSRCSASDIKVALSRHVTDDPDDAADHTLVKRQTDALLQQLITSQELLLEKHCSNGTGLCVRGTKGNIGPKGDIGIRGERGLEGIRGTPGDNGTDGVKGIAGGKGGTGKKGNSGLQGSKGLPGQKGDKGIPGERGLEGPPGQHGVNGTAGVRGLMGSPGQKGEPGLKGNRGLPGAKGDVGSAGPRGPKGDTGPDGLTSNYDVNCTCAVGPQITGGNETITAQMGTDVILNCSTSGNPPPRITWTRNGRPLPSAANKDVLVIHNTRQTDAGLYRCNADNGLGSVEKTFNFKLIDLDCDFELDYCSWTQGLTDNVDWRYHTGGTATPNTGPSGDHTTGHGYYVYLETSSGKPGDKADLISPLISAGQMECLTFWYHMHGQDINSLEVFLQYNDASRSLVFSMKGSQGDQWRKAVVSIPSQSRPYKVVMESLRGLSIQGDIGLDDIKVQQGECPVTPGDLNCHFDTGLCHWHQMTGDKGDLLLNQGSTPSLHTGPKTDHTTNTNKGRYLYYKSSSGVVGDQVRITSPLVNASSGICFSVWYHMFGTGMGKLSIYTEVPGQTKQLLWTRTGSQGSSWNLAKFTIPVMHQSFHVIIQTERGTSATGDIAIDDISVTPQACLQSVNGLGCNFEKNFCQWKQGTKDNFDWLIKSGPPSPGYLGPAVDHTLQTWKGHYMYVDPLYRAGRSTSLMSPLLATFQIYCLDFWYYLDGANVGSIFVRRSVVENDVEKLLELTVGSSKTWQHTQLNVAQYYIQCNLKIEGVRGTATNSYLAIDDIKLTKGVCT